ncbi:MAG: PadR family transcriptional regulator [Promethearchaeota archaeon]
MNDEDESILSDFTRFYLLVLLYEEPTHGYALRQKFKERIGKNVSYSLIYPFLEKLEKKKYIEMELIKIGQKEKKKFHLTDEGKKFAEKMFQRFSGIIDTAIEPNIQICAGCGVKLYQNAYQEVINGKKLLFCCRHCAAHYRNSNQR